MAAPLNFDSSKVNNVQNALENGGAASRIGETVSKSGTEKKVPTKEGKNHQKNAAGSSAMSNESAAAESDEVGGENDVLIPDVYWNQTDGTVKLKIQLIGVENDSYRVSLLKNRFFRFS